MYSEENVSLVRQIRKATGSLNLNRLYQRKFNGILNALEMQVEDGDYDQDVVDCLCAAIQNLCKRHGANPSLLKEPLDQFRKNVVKSTKGFSGSRMRT